jgi:mannose/cellobiose epimerase-like protein (N-acyl-D-glucosamine 2-epimerase family)
MPAIPFDEVRRWCFEDALPVWSQAGRDGPDGGFVEMLDLQGRPADPGFKRVRVQARQIYTFSHAAVLGWSGGLEAARAGYRFLIDHARLADGGWARRLTRDGGVLDPTLDLYDQAFVLLALAWYRRASGEAEPLALAHETMDAIERRLGRDDGRGFHAAEPSPGLALQNPHMHLLESSLALHEASGEARWAELADRLGTLFETTFFDPATGTLAEEFDEADWRKLSDPDGASVEPGHQFEWVWLLDKADRLTGADRGRQARAMYDFGARHGLNAHGAAIDELDDQGRVRRASARLWPQTELLKARLARAERGEEVDLDGIVISTRLLLDRYLAPAPRGGWWDQFDADGALMTASVPASSLYHLWVAFMELLRLEPMLAGG